MSESLKFIYYFLEENIPRPPCPCLRPRALVRDSFIHNSHPSNAYSLSSSPTPLPSLITYSQLAFTFHFAAGSRVSLPRPALFRSRRDVRVASCVYRSTVGLTSCGRMAWKMASRRSRGNGDGASSRRGIYLGELGVDTDGLQRIPCDVWRPGRRSFHRLPFFVVSSPQTS